jgi:predicted N-acetyltransferase YhbS
VWLLICGCISSSVAAVWAGALVQAAEAEAVRRGCEQMVLSTHSFQSPAFYQRLGYEKQAVIRGQPKGHANVIYAKRLKGHNVHLADVPQHTSPASYRARVDLLGPLNVS